jgi:RNA polymerase sigma-70 factor (ECF subfamily)
VPLSVEPELVESARLGGESLDWLIAAVWTEAYRVAFGILRDRGLAEDAAQEACAAIARGLPALKNAGAFRTWSYRIMANRAITTARGRQRLQTLDAAGDRAVEFDRSDTLDLYNALALLPAAQRAVVILHYYIGLNSREIADAIELPAPTVRFHLMLARRALREALSTTATSVVRSFPEVTSDAR